MSQFYDDPKREAERHHSTGWLSSASEDHVIIHEIAHGLHFKKLGDYRFRQIRRLPVPPEIKQAVSREVSIYGSTDNMEIVAEVYAGMKAGKKYSSQIMDYYRSIEGPELS
jgi:hypothetical protein